MTPQQWANLRALAAAILEHPDDQPLTPVEASYVRQAVDAACRQRCAVCHRTVDAITARCALCAKADSADGCHLRQEGRIP